MLSVAEALDRLFKLVQPVGTEQVSLAEGAGRVLREDVEAARTQPPFDTTAMDGYAVRLTDAQVGAQLALIGEAAAGRRFHEPVAERTCVRIFTGAPLPSGTDAILIQENAERRDDRVAVLEAPRAGEFIRPAGGDFSAGEHLSSPRLLTARDIALIAAMNVPQITVSRRPVIALIPTGDELVMPGNEPGPDQIVTSNNFGLAAMLTAIGAEPRLCPIAADTPESLLNALGAARGSDVIVTLGGASVGITTLLPVCSETQDSRFDFHRIAMRPGKPLMSGRIDDTLMLGLPGNPVSAMVCGEIFLRPAIEAIMGLEARPRMRQTARLTHDLGANGGREHYMRARVDPGPDGLVCSVFENQDSSLLGVLSKANALVIRDPNAPPAPISTVVECILLDK